MADSFTRKQSEYVLHLHKHGAKSTHDLWHEMKTKTRESPSHIVRTLRLSGVISEIGMTTPATSKEKPAKIYDLRPDLRAMSAQQIVEHVKAATTAEGASKRRVGLAEVSPRVRREVATLDEDGSAEQFIRLNAPYLLKTQIAGRLGVSIKALNVFAKSRGVALDEDCKDPRADDIRGLLGFIRVGSKLRDTTLGLTVALNGTSEWAGRVTYHFAAE